MPGNSFGQLFRITSFGESHGVAIGVVIDGCPAGLEISLAEIQAEVDRRRPGQSPQTSARQEKDKIEILSGIFEGRTLGTPIALLAYNQDANSASYNNIKDKYRPGHADYVYDVKYGFRDWRGGGRSSARETLARVAAGAIAKKLLANSGIEIKGNLIQVGEIKDPGKFFEAIDRAKYKKDSLGGVVEVVARNVPIGLGDPVFDKLSADLAKAALSIPAAKGFEIGDGFESVKKFGSENNDQLKNQAGKIRTVTNHAGGIVGGISNGEDIVLRIAFKPTSSIAKEQTTVNQAGEETAIEVSGRHDPCVAVRAVSIAEAMVSIVLADHFLLNKVSRL